MQQNPPLDKYQGFSLSSVCWGYRDIFAKTLEGLFGEGLIGKDRPEVTRSFFSLMRCAEQQHFDYVLKEFLSALNPGTAWILNLPGIFAEVTETGRQFAETKLHYGISYFRILGEGGFGHSPQQVRRLMTILKRLRTIDDDLALAFLSGYKALVVQLEPSEIDVYVQEGIQLFHRNRQTGMRFMEGTLKTSGRIIQSLTHECRLPDIKPLLERLLRALVGYEVEVGDLGALDSDELLERNTRMVCMARWLYLPLRMRHFDLESQNRAWYLLDTVIAAGMLALDSFSRIHGHPSFTTCEDLVGQNQLAVNLFQLVEFARVLQGIKRMWPGARNLVDFGIATELDLMPPQTPADQLFFSIVHDGFDSGSAIDPNTVSSQSMITDSARADALRAILDIADTSVNVFDTVSLLTPDFVAQVGHAYPGLDRFPLRAFAFLPDFLYPAAVSHPPQESLVADLKQKAKKQREKREQTSDDKAQAHTDDMTDKDKMEDEEQGEAVPGIEACFVYDEWSQEENDYYLNYCHVYEKHPAPASQSSIPGDIASLASQTRRIFELLRPELTKQKYLSAGDNINVDLLTEYMVLRKKEPAPKVNFYEKPYRDQRDLAVVILLDVSGSTGSEVDKRKTIEIEKQAALILGQGLATLDDRFAICGFSGNGRELCEYFIFKDFDERWDKTSKARVLSAYPRSSTRIGAALRHAGYRLSLVPAKQKLIILITDGKPMDTAYDPNTRYAQYDVRMACEENRRKCIHTFCISTDDNSRADMEIMFPERRFAILSDIRRLPRILPRLYIKLTV